MSMRNEMTLFVDDTLPVCIFAPADEGERAAHVPAWAGWFEAPRAYAVPRDRAIVYAVNRKGLAPQKPAPPLTAKDAQVTRGDGAGK